MGVTIVLGAFVSTHSRAEAAAYLHLILVNKFPCFNTQPRGGGCKRTVKPILIISLFQHTAARRRLHGVH